MSEIRVFLEISTICVNFFFPSRFREIEEKILIPNFILNFSEIRPMLCCVFFFFLGVFFQKKNNGTMHFIFSTYFLWVREKKKVTEHERFRVSIPKTFLFSVIYVGCTVGVLSTTCSFLFCSHCSVLIGNSHAPGVVISKKKIVGAWLLPLSLCVI